MRENIPGQETSRIAPNSEMPIDFAKAAMLVPAFLDRLRKCYQRHAAHIDVYRARSFRGRIHHLHLEASMACCYKAS